MATPTAERLLTADEFMLLPSSEGKRELVLGRVIEMAPVGADHGRRQFRLGSLLEHFVQRHSLGLTMVETGFRLARDPDVVRAPDASFVAAARLPKGRLPRTYFDGPPDLAVEVTSPSDLDADVAAKLKEYLEAGTARVWVVRPELETVTVHKAGGDAHTYTRGDTLDSDAAGFEAEGFALNLDELFE